LSQYSCLSSQTQEDGDYAILPLRNEDIFLIMEWRNQQIDILRQGTPLTHDQQQLYYNDVIRPSFSAPQPDLLLFSYLFAGECIGYGGLVHIDWGNKRGEVSFLVNTERLRNDNIYKDDFSTYLALIKKAAFDDLKFHRLYTETFNISGARELHMEILEQNDFEYEGRMRDHVAVGNKYVDSILHGCISRD